MALIAKRAAFFDVDNTLVRGSTLYFLGRGMYQRGFFTKADISRFVVANLRFRMTGTEKQEVIEKFQNAATDFIGGHAVEGIKKIGEEIYDEFVSPKLWQGTFDIAKSHLDKGEEVWLVTAAPQDMANIIAQRLGLTGALGSKARVLDGVYTGTLDGKLLHGVEKALAIQELAKTHGYDLADCYSYSDSHNDIPLLQAVGHPCAINPDAVLRIRALAEGWPIHDFRRARFLNRILGPAVSRIAVITTWLMPPKR
ncbi:MAG: HAD-IB family hydrolase [Candidatus Planktophila sp.]|jgi:HAD superfamily hydrolase (TIGR01490 family)|tara:strand:- start:4615 stop:5376 length:762 start_codon:yes stop_codon:yes gene_type:complete